MTLEPGHRPDPAKVAQHPASRPASSPTGRAARAALLYALAATALIVGADRLAAMASTDSTSAALLRESLGGVLIALTSLSKRSNVPGLRSGFVAGDAALIKPFLLYRTYHGSAMSPVLQSASIAAWNDEAHVVDNRNLYRSKFAKVTPLLASVMDVALPDAGFYLWARVAGGDDVAFALDLLAQYNVAVLPGSLLARESGGINPGAGRVRLALVAGVDECVEAAERIRSFIQSI